MALTYGVKYAGAAGNFAEFAGPTDTKTFLAAIRKDEPGTKFVAIVLATGEAKGW